MKRRNKVMMGIIGVSVGMLMVSGMLEGTNGQETVLAGNPEGKHVNVGSVAVKDIQAKISSTGILEAKQSEDVRSEASGQVEKVVVEVGDTVKAGDVLIMFDEITRAGLERELEQLDLQLETARIKLTQLQNPTPKSITTAEMNATAKQNAVDTAKEAIRQTKTALEFAQTDLSNAKKQNDTTKVLFEEGLVSQQQLEDGSTAFQLAEDKVITTEHQLVTQQNSLESAIKEQEIATYDLDVLLNHVADQTKMDNIRISQNDIAGIELKREALLEELENACIEVLAPVDGTVAALYIEDGEHATPGKTLVKIIDPDYLIAKAEISPYYAAQLEEGLKVQVKFNGSTTIETTGTVDMVSPVAIQKQSVSGGASSSVIPVEIVIDRTDGLKEGLLVDLKVITTDVEDVVSVPLLATLEDNEKESYVFVVREDGTLEKRYVKEGAADNQYVQVSDVQEGEIVVTNPTQALKDGEQVSYVPIVAGTGDVQ